MNNLIENSKLNIKLNKRIYKLKKNNNYKIPSKGLIQSWKVLNCGFIPILVVNDYKIKHSRKQKELISIPELRKYIREIEFPQTQIEKELDNIENNFCMYQLYATEYYKTLPNEDLFNSLFTRDINVNLYFGPNAPDEIEIEEEYWDRNSDSNNSFYTDLNRQ